MVDVNCPHKDWKWVTGSSGGHKWKKCQNKKCNHTWDSKKIRKSK